MKTLKAVSYSFPTSANAEKLGFTESGCWHVEQTYLDIEGSGQCRTFLPHNAEGFAAPDDPALIASYMETDGESSTSFLRFGDARALLAIKIQIQNDWLNAE
jgi:hypothetical protein